MSTDSFKNIHEVEGTSKPSTPKTWTKKKKEVSVDSFVKGITSGNIALLSRAITLIESTNHLHLVKANQVIEQCLPFANNSIRIGITGVPGVGKSTFIEALGKFYLATGKKVAVLAIDPSSSLNKGSILGDKTRMEELVTLPKAFIRPSPSGSSLGGVAQKTRETIVLCEAAGFDVILIETVGVGQSETAVHSMVDFFLLLKLAGAGDELQGIKRGIIEMADAIVINKADKENVKNSQIAKVTFNKALHLYPPKSSGWTPKVVTASALENKGIEEVALLIKEYIKLSKNNGYFEKNRNSQNQYWLQSSIQQQLNQSFFENPLIKEELLKQNIKVEQGELTPFMAAQNLLHIYNDQLLKKS